MLKNKLYVHGPSVQIPSHLHSGQHLLEKMMKYKNQVAMVNSDTSVSLTYGEIAKKTVDIALSLTRMGVRKGDVISICSESRFEFIPTVLGVFCAGATFSPTDITYGAVPLLHRVKIARPKVMFCSPTAFDQHKGLFDTAGCIETYIVYEEEKPGAHETMLRHDDTKPKQNQKARWLSFKDFLTETGDVNEFLSVPVDGWSDLSMILFSSGTTGLPKGVPWTHLANLINIQSNADESFEGHGLLITKEWHYSYGLVYTIAGLSRGATIVYSCRNSLEDCLSAIQKYKIKYLQLTPGSVTELIKSPILQEYDLSSVQGIISSSTTIMADQVLAVKDRLPSLRGVYQLYGISEAGCVCSELGAPLGTRPGSAGVPTYGNILKVVDMRTRLPLGPGEKGEICIKSLCLTPVAPAELETILLQHPAVKEVGVVGAPHAGVGEAPTAFVVLQDGERVDEDDLVQFLEDRITFRMRLAGGARFVEQLPRGAGGKLDRNALKNML